MLFYVKFMANKQIPLPPDAVQVGHVLGAWGVKGALRIQSYNVQADALMATNLWHLLPPEQPFGVSSSNNLDGMPKPKGNHAEPSSLSTLTITHVREHDGTLVVEAQEVKDRTAAEQLKGARILVRRSEFPEPEDGEFYWVDLIGLRVVNLQGEALGHVTDLMSNGVQSILRIQRVPESVREGQKNLERLIPFVDAFIASVNLQAGFIQVDWPMEDD